MSSMKDCGIRFRIAAPSDFDGLQRLIQSAYRGTSAAAGWHHEGELATDERITRAALAELSNSDNRRLFVAVQAGDLVGSALLERGDAEDCSISLLCVAPHLQGRGYGDQLLRHAEAEAVRAFAATYASLEVLEHKCRLITYYERRGYRRTGQTRPYTHKLVTPAKFVTLCKRIDR